MKASIRQRARELGLDLCGVAAAGPAQTHPRYVDWLARSYHGQMAYLARPDAVTRRADLRALLPQARSVIAVAMNYYTGPARPLGAEVARYAWGPDYHGILAGQLEQLATWIEAQAGRPVAHKVCVDTSALLEREWAARAGLGWIGKNTMLVNPRLGSWLVLGELLLDLDLDPDLDLVPDRCGTCTRCIEACPTGCLLPGRTLDARRCLAYLTIELRGDAPAWARDYIGPRIFGCDVCQEVCPWNRFARPSTVEVNPAWAALDPAEVLAMDEAAFRARFAGSAIARAKREGLARNAALVMGKLDENI